MIFGTNKTNEMEKKTMMPILQVFKYPNKHIKQLFTIGTLFNCKLN